MGKLCNIMSGVFLMVLAVVLGQSEGAKVLVYPYGHCVNSHLLNGEKISQILAEGGHDVSMVISSMYHVFDHIIYDSTNTSIEDSVKLIQFQAPANYTSICDHDSIDFILYSPVAERFDTFVGTSVQYCDEFLSNTALLRMLKRANFDVLIYEALDPCGRILADYLDISSIPLFSAGLGHYDGNFRPPSYVPAALAPFTAQMSFFQRMRNMFYKTMYEFIPVMMGFDTHFENLKQKYGINTSLSIADTYNRATLKLVNSDFTIEYPSPVEPDSILIGGFSINQAKPLPDELESFMESSGEHGVIIVTLGTIVKRYNDHWTRVFAEAFAKVPQKVIWRYYSDNDTITYPFSNNIKLVKWMPQTDLVAHPKTRLLVTHCGLGGTFEMAYFGKPVVAVPLSADMYNHATKLTEHLGMGVSLDIHSLTSDKLYDGIQTVLGDDTYTKNAKEVSDRFRDQPMAAADKINFWVNYIARHGGASHLKSEAHKLTWYQYFSLDVIAFLFLACLTIFSLVVFGLYTALWYLSRWVKGLVTSLLQRTLKSIKMD